MQTAYLLYVTYLYVFTDKPTLFLEEFKYIAIVFKKGRIELHISFAVYSKSYGILQKSLLTV